MMRALVAAMVSAALAASVRPASAQGDGGEDRPRGNGTVKIEVEKRGERRADAGGAPRPARTDPALFHTEVDVSWNGFAPSPELVDRLPEVEARDAAARREAAARIAARGPEGVRYLVTLLGRGDLFIEDAAEDALARLGADDTSRVAAGLFHPHFRVRSRTATVLGRMGERGRSAAPELERALLDDNSFVRESAARALGALRSPEEVVVRALTFALGDPDSFVRFRAAEGLAAVGPAALPAIEPLCDTLAYDEDRYARISAGRALVAVGEPEERIAAELAGVLADGEESVVRQARELLAVHLDRHADALPALFPMVDDERLSDAVREFLVRRTGSDFPNAQAWRAWYDSRGK